jgi:type IV secretion system protein VirB10
MANEQTSSSAAGSPVQDHRPKPPGVLPRQLQMWLMVGIAATLLLIILLTGHSQPAPRAQTAERSATPRPAIPERIRAYQQQLSDQEQRLHQVQAEASAATRQAAPGDPQAAPRTDPVADEQRRREYQSLFADNIALSRRPVGQQPSAAPASTKPASAPAKADPSAQALAALALLAQSQPGVRAGATPVAGEAPAAAPPMPSPTSGRAEKPRDENPAPGPRLKLLEGTVIETALLNRLDGTFAGPVECLVTTPVYSHDRHVVLVPAGARVLGAAAPVQNWGDARLAVSFHRLIMPDGHTYSLDAFKGLDQAGATGLKDEIDRHYRQVFGASLAIGAISGLAQYSTRGLDASTFADTYRQSAGASLASSSSRVLDRYLNVLPTVTIREGFRIKVYLTDDFDLPAYVPTAGERP